MSTMSMGARLFHFTVLALLGLVTQWALAPPPRLEVVVPEGADPRAVIEDAVLLAEVERLDWLEQDAEIRRHLVKVYGEASGRVHLDPTALLEEAKALGLHRSDRVVRRWLLARARRELVGKVPIPDEETLQAHLAANLDRFVASPRYTISLRYRARHVHGTSWPAVVAATARQVDPDTDPLPSGVRSTITATESRFRAQFGPAFALTVAQAPPEAWVGPVLTEDAAWFVRVDHVTPRSVPSLDRIRNEVWTDWSREQGKRQVARALEQLVGQWRVEVVNL